LVFSVVVVEVILPFSIVEMFEKFEIDVDEKNTKDSLIKISF